MTAQESTNMEFMLGQLVESIKNLESKLDKMPTREDFMALTHKDNHLEEKITSLQLEVKEVGKNYDELKEKYVQLKSELDAEKNRKAGRMAILDFFTKYKWPLTVAGAAIAVVVGYLAESPLHKML